MTPHDIIGSDCPLVIGQIYQNRTTSDHEAMNYIKISFRVIREATPQEYIESVTSRGYPKDKLHMSYIMAGYIYEVEILD